ncbi:hypothetical protein BHS05_09015 [Myxococcus xanthus]|nr:hypothetical protein BHS05_09015 [Myxococcus xanthus]QDF03348.1 hypothetical protein BHS04_09020 [Myxococcus xanthus]
MDAESRAHVEQVVGLTDSGPRPDDESASFEDSPELEVGASASYCVDDPFDAANAPRLGEPAHQTPEGREDALPAAVDVRQLHDERVGMKSEAAEQLRHADADAGTTTCIRVLPNIRELSIA